MFDMLLTFSSSLMVPNQITVMFLESLTLFVKM